MKWFVRGFITLFDLVLLLVLVRAIMPTPGVAQLSELSPDASARWTPPAWHPEPESLWALTQLDHAAPFAGGPRIRAQVALVADLDRGEILWGQGIDQRRPIASLTKLMSALTLSSHDPDLAQTLCVTRDIWPSLRGAKSKFETGECHEGWEYVGAALVASDNRGAMAMPALADQTFEAFVEDMHRVSYELNLDAPSWVDPAGLDDGN
jgi:D-alanyl-D-alanine carboxypeptidase